MTMRYVCFSIDLCARYDDSEMTEAEAINKRLATLGISGIDASEVDIYEVGEEE